jgi:hypothetical protein
MAGINPGIRAAIKVQRPKTCKEAIEAANKLEGEIEWTTKYARTNIELKERLEEFKRFTRPCNKANLQSHIIKRRDNPLLSVAMKKRSKEGKSGRPTISLLTSMTKLLLQKA